eukprot:scaffold39233_cov40-Prasinocladus_malaysianus.AAC.1
MKSAGTKIEVQDSGGNLNGAHTVGVNTSLHAFIIADSLVGPCPYLLGCLRQTRKASEKLENAVMMVADALRPANCDYKSFKVISNGQAVLVPALYDENDEEQSFTELQTQIAAPSAWKQAPLTLNAAQVEDLQPPSKIDYVGLIRQPADTGFQIQNGVSDQPGIWTTDAELWRCSNGAKATQQQLSWAPTKFAQCQKETETVCVQANSVSQYEYSPWAATSPAG